MSVEDYLQGNEITHNATVDLAKLRKFQTTHDAHINRKSPDPIFKPAYTFSYRESTCGTSVSITCTCGKKSDITDYSDM